MKICVLNGSPAGENSITLQTILLIQKYDIHSDYEILHVGKNIRSYERDLTATVKALEESDLVLFCYPVYTFLVPAQLHRFLELLKEKKVSLRGKFATQITTSKHFYDTTAHQFIQDVCQDFQMKYIQGLSADMEDLLSEKGQREALQFSRYVRWNMKRNFYEPENPLFSEVYRAAEEKLKDTAVPPEKTRTDQPAFNTAHQKKKTVIITDLPEKQNESRLSAMIRRFINVSAFSCEVVNLREFPFRGGCLGCFHCAFDGTCIYQDGFDEYLRTHIQTADVIVYAYTIRDHSMGSTFKLFDDRQFCNGHRTVMKGKPVGYLVDGCLSLEKNLQNLMEARAQVGGNFLAGIACDERDPEKEIDRLAASIEYASCHSYQPPANFYGVGGRKIFRDLIYLMQGLMREDHRFYKVHGFYDFPQRHKGRILGMYALGAMMNSPKLSKKIGGKMTEGMLMPYRKVLKKHDRS